MVHSCTLKGKVVTYHLAHSAGEEDERHSSSSERVPERALVVLFGVFGGHGQTPVCCVVASGEGPEAHASEALVVPPDGSLPRDAVGRRRVRAARRLLGGAADQLRRPHLWGRLAERFPLP